MKTLLFASALLLSAAGADGSAGGSPNEPDPNLNDAGAAPAPEGETIAAPSETNAPLAETAAPDPVDLTEFDEDFQRRLEAERAEFDRIRELTPVQEVELRALAGASHLGVIIGTPDGIRCVPLADWRTDRLCLKAGDHAQIVVLAGEGLKSWEFYREQEARAKSAVKTVSLEPAAAAALVGGLAANLQSGGADSAGSAPVDPLEETLPAGSGLPNSSATPDPATGP